MDPVVYLLPGQMPVGIGRQPIGLSCEVSLVGREMPHPGTQYSRPDRDSPRVRTTTHREQQLEGEHNDDGLGKVADGGAGGFSSATCHSRSRS